MQSRKKLNILLIMFYFYIGTMAAIESIFIKYWRILHETIK